MSGGGLLHEDGQRLPRPLFALLFAVTFMTAVGNLGLVSVMPAIGRALAIPDVLIATTFSLSALAWALTSPLWARRSDRQGRKPMLLLGLGGFCVSMGGCGLVVLGGLQALAPPLAIFAVFMLVRSSYGLFGSAAATAAQALVADRSGGTARVRAMSAMASALSLGTIAGPAIAPFFIIAPFGLAGPPLAFALVGLALIGGVLALLPRDRPIATSSVAAKTSLWRDPAVRPLLTQGMVIASAQAINIYTLGFAIIDHGGEGSAMAQWWIGATMSLGAASGLAAQIGLVTIARPSPLAMLYGGATVVLIGNIIASLPTGLPSLVAGFAIASFGYGLARPGFSAAASLAVSAERQGAVAGAISSIAGASIAVPPVIAILLYQRWWIAPFVLAASGAAWVMLAGWRRR
jgi:MFS family permease